MNRFAQFKQFLVSVVAELKRTTWPGFKEVRGTTIVVLVTIFICSAYLWVVDMFLNRGMDLVFRTFGQ